MTRSQAEVTNEFTKGPEGWCSYDYHASMVHGGTNIFILATWARSGGPGDAGYVWTDNTRWSADTPEVPLSILPLLFYRNWIDEDPIDLRNAGVSVYLRGDHLELDGAECLFWVHGVGGRWHLNSRPLPVADADWSSEPFEFPLTDDEELWHHSWPRNDQTKPLTQVLGAAHSYGFSFTGFSSEVTGRLSMCQFQIVQGAAGGSPGVSGEALESQFTDPARRFWQAVPGELRKKLITNVWCGACSQQTTIVDYRGKMNRGHLVLEGVCQKCGGSVARVVEGK